MQDSVFCNSPFLYAISENCGILERLLQKETLDIRGKHRRIRKHIFLIGKVNPGVPTAFLKAGSVKRGFLRQKKTGLFDIAFFRLCGTSARPLYAGRKTFMDCASFQRKIIVVFIVRKEMPHSPFCALYDKESSLFFGAEKAVRIVKRNRRRNGIGQEDANLEAECARLIGALLCGNAFKGKNAFLKKFIRQKGKQRDHSRQIVEIMRKKKLLRLRQERALTLPVKGNQILSSVRANAADSKEGFKIRLIQLFKIEQTLKRTDLLKKIKLRQTGQRTQNGKLTAAL